MLLKVTVAGIPKEENRCRPRKVVAETGKLAADHGKVVMAVKGKVAADPGKVCVKPGKVDAD